jgi:hypothetical protein
MWETVPFHDTVDEISPKEPQERIEQPGNVVC